MIPFIQSCRKRKCVHSDQKPIYGCLGMGAGEEGRRETTKGHEVTLKGVGVFTILIVLRVPRVYTNVKIHQKAWFKHMQSVESGYSV